MSKEDSLLQDQDGSDGSSGEGSGEEQPIEESSDGGKKRAFLNSGGLVMFGLLALVGGATYLMVLKAGGQATLMSPQTAQADTTITNFLNNGSQVQSLQKMLRDTEKIETKFDTYPAAHQVPLDGLKTNPFVSPHVKAAPVAAPLSDDAEKRQEEDNRQKAAAVAATLKLQSIALGMRSICMINGRTYAEGQSGDTFTVEKIQPQGVWVRIGDARFQITMSPPKLN